MLVPNISCLRWSMLLMIVSPFFRFICHCLKSHLPFLPLLTPLTTISLSYNLIVVAISLLLWTPISRLMPILTILRRHSNIVILVSIVSTVGWRIRPRLILILPNSCILLCIFLERSRIFLIALIFSMMIIEKWLNVLLFLFLLLKDSLLKLVIMAIEMVWHILSRLMILTVLKEGLMVVDVLSDVLRCCEGLWVSRFVGMVEAVCRKLVDEALLLLCLLFLLEFGLGLFFLEDEDGFRLGLLDVRFWLGFELVQSFV